MAATVNSEMNGSGSAATEARDIRLMVPELGLKEYWYPAIWDKEVGWRKPVLLKLLGEDICLFRGKSGKVAALANSCPHRGAMLSSGDIQFKGFLTCFYHAWTWDENGECVAVLSEGPDSPHPGKVCARTYPAVTLKGIVFLWMGKGEPAPLNESIPEEFFDDDAQVFNWITYWPCNWRIALENVADSHFRYVHRNSALCLMRPIAPPTLGDRGRATIVGKHRLRPPAPMAQDKAPNERPYQDYYPGVDAKWPRSRWRLSWTWMFDWSFKRKWRRPIQVSDEWGPGSHLPSLVRLNYGSHLYTRWVTAVDAKTTRAFYFHATKPSNWLGRVYERIHWTLFHNWAMNKNFSEQDRKGALEVYWPAAEHLSGTDAQTIMWRRLLLTARGLEIAKLPSEAPKNSADGAHPNGAQPEQEAAATASWR